MRSGRVGAGLLVAPLFLFLLLSFLAPIAVFLWRGVTDTEVATTLPRTIAALRDWDGTALPSDAAFAALVEDLRAARARDREAGTGEIARAAARLNTDRPGMRGVLPATARRVDRALGLPPREAVLEAAPDWEEVESWGAIRRAAGPLTAFHLLAALDFRRDAAGGLHESDQPIFRRVILRSLWIGALCTLIALLLGWPLAWLIATTTPRVATLLLGAVLLPFWTSLVVRTAAWMVLLQREGVVNSALLQSGLVQAALPLLFNRTAVLLSMTHILLPFMVLPLAASFAALDKRLLRAAASLGAPPWRRFLRVTLPLSLPGIGAGCVLVFIQALGFYVTPALLGGPDDQMLAWFIGFYANRTVNWGIAAALSLILLAAVALCATLYARLRSGVVLKA